MKRLVFCFDGTWNKLSTNCPTNVVLVAEMVAPIAKGGVPQIVYYDEGIGTAKSEHFMGGAFGKGMMTNIREAYRFLLFNYEPGDQIYAFGFSRGAYTARSFLGFIRHAIASLGITTAQSAGRQNSLDTCMPEHRLRCQANLREQALRSATREVKHRLGFS